MKKETDDKDLTVDSYDYLGKSASATDYTGLIPSAPRNDYELESYEEIYPFRPPRLAGEHGPAAVSGKANTRSGPDKGPSEARG